MQLEATERSAVWRAERVHLAEVGPHLLDIQSALSFQDDAHLLVIMRLRAVRLHQMADAHL